jgi:hypothetical protein
MFSKIQSLFSKDSSRTATSLSDSFEHPSAGSGDAAQCPFMKQKGKTQEASTDKCPVTGKAVPKGQVDSDSEE